MIPASIPQHADKTIWISERVRVGFLHTAMLLVPEPGFFLAGLRFFTSGWMSSGSNYLGLLKQVDFFLLVDASVRISFDP